MSEHPFRIASPLFLVLFPVFIIFFILYVKNRIGRETTLSFSSLGFFRAKDAVVSIPQRNFFLGIRGMALLLLGLALLRPQQGEGIEEIRDKGIDLVMALDVSGSMKALDFLPKNRLEGAKEAAKSFIERRKGDRIGLVVFAGESYLQCPLTLDHEQLLRLLEEVTIGMVEDGTAIGLALARSVERMKESDAETQVVVLLTDGINNAGGVDPMEAAQLASHFGVKVYTIGAGKTGMSLYPVEEKGPKDELLSEEKYVRVLNELDEPVLQAMAKATGGQYFRVEDKLSLDRTFQEIDRLEKVGVISKRYKNYLDLYRWLVWPAFVLLSLEILLRNAFFLKIP